MGKNFSLAIQVLIIRDTNPGPLAEQPLRSSFACKRSVSSARGFQLLVFRKALQPTARRTNENIEWKAPQADPFS